ncbi:endoplasmic reticulum resident protein 29 [Cydia splendana]|uniref:endoplasmic reticulum resident protein 29 n=1 Tax=Cydia splendana TaxID=1100963 RepID=UPI0021203578
MQWYLLALCLVFLLPPAYSNSLSGTVELNDYTFDKILKKFDATLVKFDVAFPYGDKHDAYTALAKDAKEEDDFLIAEVGVKDYGDRDNEALAKKYGATKDNFPVVKLFIKGKKEPITYNPDKEITSDELRRFVREHTGVHLSLPGCVRSLDKLAVKFMKADNEDRKKILEDGEDTFKKLPSKQANSAKIYKTILEKIIEKGDGFVKTEHERITKLLNGKLSEEKKKEMGQRINILQTFQLHETKVDKEEL